LLEGVKMKRIIYFLFLLVFGLPIVFAEDVEIINVTTFGELKVAVENICIRNTYYC
jgi:hypothetical protein